MSDVLTLAEVAARLKCCQRTVRRAINERGLPAVEIASRGGLRVLACDLERWLEEQATVPRAAAAPAGVVAQLAAVRSPVRRRVGHRGHLAVTADMGRQP